MTISVGIDYSLTSPCMCVMLAPSFDGARFFYLTSEKRYEGVAFGNIRGDLHAKYSSEQERHNSISQYFIDRLVECNVETNVHITLEDYSYGSKGKVFNLAENCGLLKHKLWKAGYIIDTVAPSALKKFATGKGNAKKEQMYDAFLALGYPDINATLSPKKTVIGNPVSDVVDSFYLALLGAKNSK